MRTVTVGMGPHGPTLNVQSNEPLALAQFAGAAHALNRTGPWTVQRQGPWTNATGGWEAEITLHCMLVDSGDARLVLEHVAREVL